MPKAIAIRKQIYFLLFFYLSGALHSQDIDSLMATFDKGIKPHPVTATFKTTKLINLQTIEQVKRGELDFRISHRFDDISGTAGGVKTMYGFDNVTDIRIGFDYGLTDRWVIGIGRSKGAYLRRQIVDFNTKVKVLQQKDNNSMPVSVSLFASSELCTMKSSPDTLSDVYFDLKPAHRLNYVFQLLIARKFNKRLSVQLVPSMIHRNLVNYKEKNTTFAICAGLRYKFTKRVGIILDYCYSLDPLKTPANGYYAPLGVGIEIETGGHVFQLLFSNNRSLLESQYLTINPDSWLKGQVRFGFNISRVFNIVN